MKRAVGVWPALCLDAYSTFLASDAVCSGGCWIGDGLIMRFASQLSRVATDIIFKSSYAFDVICLVSWVTDAIFLYHS